MCGMSVIRLLLVFLLNPDPSCSRADLSRFEDEDVIVSGASGTLSIQNLRRLPPDPPSSADSSSDDEGTSFGLLFAICFNFFSELRRTMMHSTKDSSKKHPY